MGRQGARLRAFLAASALLAAGAAGASCYSQGDGADPPLDRFYFPVGLRVSHGGSVLYVANADFDLQYNGGTLQSYDLTLIRRHVLEVIKDPTNPALPWVRPPYPSKESCLAGEAPALQPNGSRQPLGETCAPPVRSEFYQRDTAVIGAFATDMLLSEPPTVAAPAVPRPYDRLFIPVRGNATLTWGNVARDTVDAIPPDSRDVAAYAPWRIDCGQSATSRRCDARHQVGEDPDEVGNTRKLRMPGEPFGATLSEDGRTAVVTHQNDTKTSLFLTGIGPTDTDALTGTAEVVPSLQFVLDGVAVGGVGLAAIPHDPAAFVDQPVPYPAFLQTSRANAQIELLRQYPDEAVDLVTLADGGTRLPSGQPTTPSTLRRPFLTREILFPITTSPSGVDSRDLAIDPTPRLACKARARTPDEVLACARKPSRLFVANRSPAALLVGEVGGTNATTGAYDPDLVTIFRSEPLAAGPSRVFLAPIVDSDGAYALRVFVVCFDAAQVFVFDPEAGRLESVIRTGPGPFAMAFDPFDMAAVARHDKVEDDKRIAGLTRYRFGYVASFTQSYVQVLDLDRRQPSTFERVVFTLGEPTNPKGT